MSTGAPAPEAAPSTAERARRLQQEFQALSAELGRLVEEDRAQSGQQLQGAAHTERGEERRRQVAAAGRVLQSLQDAMGMWESCK